MARQWPQRHRQTQEALDKTPYPTLSRPDWADPSSCSGSTPHFGAPGQCWALANFPSGMNTQWSLQQQDMEPGNACGSGPAQKSKPAPWAGRRVYISTASLAFCHELAVSLFAHSLYQPHTESSLSSNSVLFLSLSVSVCLSLCLSLFRSQYFIWNRCGSKSSLSGFSTIPYPLLLVLTISTDFLLLVLSFFLSFFFYKKNKILLPNTGAVVFLVSLSVSPRNSTSSRALPSLSSSSSSSFSSSSRLTNHNPAKTNLTRCLQQ
ncbi:hypothetical protein BD289DRAFT_53552 [Coniella lustricola]|uniref:Uncharacterized protein n=1 Tax=Coniella lustricola TaxID=2025994 RepID=A0A2T3A105_9PEZI|nr:hypothetical protein BD289DRAFT_53552 [Coniella lustricola]